LPKQEPKLFFKLANISNSCANRRCPILGQDLDSRHFEAIQNMLDFSTYYKEEGREVSLMKPPLQFKETMQRAIDKGREI